MKSNPNAIDNPPKDIFEDISPLFMMGLCSRVEDRLWDAFESSKYKKVRRYVERWHESGGLGVDGFPEWENFEIVYKDGSDDIDLGETLHGMDNQTIIRIAHDLGLEIPGLIPSTRLIRILTENNSNAERSFRRAVEEVYDHPNESVALANSALEGILKTIAKDERLGLCESDMRRTGGKLAGVVVRALGIAAGKEQPVEVRSIASDLLGLAEAVSRLRSERGGVHGSAPEDLAIDEPMWAELVVNSVSTLGLFLWEFYCQRLAPRGRGGAISARFADEDDLG